MKKQNVILIGCAVVFLGLMVAYFVHSQSKKDFAVSEHLDETVFTLNGDEITLREVMYYVMDVENYTHKQALIYNPDDPLDYWNTHFSAGDNSAFMYTIAKNQVYEVCIVDYVFAAEAQAETFELSDEAVQTANEEAEELYNSMNDKQKEATGLELSDIQTMKQREMLATAYAEYVVANTDWSDTVISPATQMSYEGEFFQDNILSKYTVTTNDKLWKQIQLGRLTIN